MLGSTTTKQEHLQYNANLFLQTKDKLNKIRNAPINGGYLNSCAISSSSIVLTHRKRENASTAPVCTNSRYE